MKYNFRLFFILLSNLFPLYGLYYLGWSPLNAVLVFSLETIFMFVFFEISMIYRIKKKELLAILPLIFGFPIAMFSLLHIFLAVSLFETRENIVHSANMFVTTYNALSIIFLNVILIAIQYTNEFIYLIKNKHFDTPLSKTNDGGVGNLMLRLFFMQITIIIGGLVASISGGKIFGAVTLIALQTFVSLYIYFKNKPLSTT